MQALEYDCAEIDDPYAATAELCRRPLVYRALVLSLTSLFREELAVVPTIKRKFPHVEIWLTHIEGRQAALAEAMRQGADGLLAEDGTLHRMSLGTTAEAPTSVPQEATPEMEESVTDSVSTEPEPGEPVLSAEELKALLEEEPALPPDVEK